jgi:hypothetical protein
MRDALNWIMFPETSFNWLEKADVFQKDYWQIGRAKKWSFRLSPMLSPNCVVLRECLQRNVFSLTGTKIQALY